MDDARLLEWMRPRGYDMDTTLTGMVPTNRGTNQLQSYLTSRVLAIAQALSPPRELMISQYLWDRREPTFGPLDAQHETFVFAYASPKPGSPIFQPPAGAINAGFRMIDMRGWYLDSFSTPNPFDGHDEWMDMYTAEPTTKWQLTDEQVTKSVLGGMASLWTQVIDDANVDFWVWPRTAAMAERLWSPKNNSNAEDAFPRLAAQRCRMLQRGIRGYSLHIEYCVVP